MVPWRSRAFVAAAVASLTVSGCASTPPSHLDVRIVDGVPHEWVDRAAFEWARRTPATFEVDGAARPCAGACWMVIPTTREAIERGGIGRYLAWTRHARSGGGTILIAVDLSPEDGAVVMLHELGHALGLNHRTEPHAVMSASPTDAGATGVTCADVAEFYEVRALEAPPCSE